MCSLFQVFSFRSCNNPGKISFQPWKDPYVFLKVTWEDPDLSCKLILEITFFSHQEPSGSWEDYIALRRKTEQGRGVILFQILSGSRELPYYTFLPRLRCILNRILIRIERKTVHRQKKILFQILAGSRKLPYYTLRPGILRFLGKKEQFFAGSFSDRLLNLKGNHTDLH